MRIRVANLLLIPSFDLRCVGEMEDAGEGSGGDGLGGEETVEILLGGGIWCLRRRVNGAEKRKFDE